MHVWLAGWIAIAISLCALPASAVEASGILELVGCRCPGLCIRSNDRRASDDPGIGDGAVAG